MAIFDYSKLVVSLLAVLLLLPGALAVQYGSRYDMHRGGCPCEYAAYRPSDAYVYHEIERRITTPFEGGRKISGGLKRRHWPLNPGAGLKHVGKY
ncbi:hypothetical protein ABKN59_009525 [Abortiporus biennis]